MTRPPNASHSKKIKEMCENFNLTDPYRYLYPDKLEYTYVPRAAGKKNKSRLDFFILSEALLDSVSECEISTGLQNNLFDHKPVKLTLNKKKPKNEKINHTISNSNLNDDLIRFVIHATVAETYLIHFEGIEVGRHEKQALLNTCGTVKSLVRECGPPPESIIGLEPDRNFIDSRERKIVRIQVLLQSLTIRDLEQLHLNCDPSNFLETLLLNVKNEVVSYQIFARKEREKKKKWLISQINVLKKLYLINQDEILQYEKALDKLIDNEIRSELEKNRAYDILNNEKMTPRFLSICKASKKNCSLDSIRDENGVAFPSEKERDNHIVNFYKKIYTPQEGNLVLENNCIDSFLGPEICESPLIQNSKLS
jgi:hypothetical protein